jgi:hypothetical protein
MEAMRAAATNGADADALLGGLDQNISELIAASIGASFELAQVAGHRGADVHRFSFDFARIDHNGRVR